MNNTAYPKLAARLDALPNGFPPTEDGAELRLLAVLFSAEEAELAAQLRVTQETPQQIAARIGGDPSAIGNMLMSMAQRGLISAGPLAHEGGMGFGLMPFVVGIYEFQIGRIDAEMARLFEDYYTAAFDQALDVQPQYHRVIPVGETVRVDMEVHPFESAADIVAGAQAWGRIPCICRTQKALVGDPCEHPVETCMFLGYFPGAFDNMPGIEVITQDEALETLRRSADAGLVHSVSNNQDGLMYMCNCCTCSCVMLRGMAEMGIANVVARSAFVNTVDQDLCVGCEACLDYCQFDALGLNGENVVQVNATRCVGCGVCVPQCNDEALALVRRPEEDIKPVPAAITDWMQERAAARGLDIRNVL